MSKCNSLKKNHISTANLLNKCSTESHLTIKHIACMFFHISYGQLLVQMTLFRQNRFCRGWVHVTLQEVMNTPLNSSHMLRCNLMRATSIKGPHSDHVYLIYIMAAMYIHLLPEQFCPSFMSQRRNRTRIPMNTIKECLITAYQRRPF